MHGVSMLISTTILSNGILVLNASAAIIGGVGAVIGFYRETRRQRRDDGPPSITTDRGNDRGGTGPGDILGNPYQPDKDRKGDQPGGDSSFGRLGVLLGQQRGQEGGPKALERYCCALA